jgi:hypothetical protein
MPKRKREQQEHDKIKVARAVNNDRMRSLRSFSKKEEKAKALLRRKVRNRPRNENCPLTQDKLEKPIFRYITDDGFVHGYSLESLIDWLVAQGKPIDPKTRQIYNVIELKRMDREAKQHGLNKPSVYERCTSDVFRRYYQAQRDRAEQKLIVGDAIQRVLGIIKFAWQIHFAPEVPILLFECYPIFTEQILIMATLDKACALEILTNAESWEGTAETQVQIRLFFTNLKRVIAATVPDVSIHDNIEMYRDNVTLDNVMDHLLGNIAVITVEITS